MNKTLIKCTIASALGGLLFGYDTVIINGAMLDLIRYFKLTPALQGWTVSSALIGCILGTIIVARPSEKYGAKSVLIFTSILFILSGIGCGLALDINIFIISRFLGGIAIGASSVLSPIYIAEISPPKHRGVLASTFQLAIVVGILLSLLSNYFLIDIGENNWRWMLVSESFPAIAFFIMLLFIRVSPRRLVMLGKIDEARKNIQDLSSDEIDADETILEIQTSLSTEKAGKQIHLFRKPYLRIMLVGIFVGAFNQLTGIGVVFYYSSQIFNIAGFSTNDSVVQSLLLGATNLIFTLLAMLFIDKIGRKKLLLFGQIGMVIVLALFGYGLITGNIHGYWLVVLMVAYIAFFASSQGIVVWVLLAEMFPNQIRVRGVSFGSLTNWIVSTLLNFSFPVVIGLFGTSLAAQQLGLGYSFVLLSVFTLIGYGFLSKYIIEMKGKSLEAIERESLNPVK